MTTAEFLAVVLPSEGYGRYCVVELSRRKEHFYADNIAVLVPKINTWVTAGNDVFFAFCTFNTTREAVQACMVKSFCLDLDGYSSKKAAAHALDAFTERTGLAALGTPWVVDSGGGLHVYWPLTESISVGVWKPLAEALKKMCVLHGLIIDPSVTADAARVMRLPGSMNHKKKYGTPQPVRVLQEGDTFDFAAFADVVQQHVVAVPESSFAIAGVRPKRIAGAAQVKLIENSRTLFSKVCASGCAQIENYRNTAKEDGKEPQWRGILSWTKYCADGAAYAEELSALHPYTPELMQKKLHEIKGPYSCASMDVLVAGVCKNCPHFGKVTNPLVLGREILVDNTAKEVPMQTSLAPPIETLSSIEALELDVDTDVLDEPSAPPPITVRRPEPPRGFSYGKNGGVYRTVVSEGDDGAKTKKEVQILGYELFVVDLLKQENDHLVHMAAQRPEGLVTLNFPQRSIVSKDETLKWLASQNIVTGEAHQKSLYAYVLACVEQASMERKAIVVPHQCGWQEDMSFVYNNRVFTKDGREVYIPMPGLENINRSTGSRGTLTAWARVWDVFKQKKMHTMLAFCADSFGSALMRFTEYEGFMWHIGSRESGTGKSLTLSAKAGVWGHPIRYRTGKSTSPVAMQQRAGLLNSMPLLIDEITSRSRADMEWAPTFIFDYAEGQGKERMESGANKERINNSTWAATGTMTSNVQLLDYMAGARTFSSNGELMRMLEWNPSKELSWDSNERETLKELKRNYGVAGEAWVRWLVKNQDLARKVLSRVEEELRKRMNFSDLERYWQAGCATTVAAAVLLGPKYANIFEMPVEGIIDALHVLINNARLKFRSNIRSAEDVLNAYTGNNYGGFVIIKKTQERMLLASWGEGGTIDKSITRNKVLGRVEHGVLTPGYVDYFIEEQLLKQHCVNMSYGYDEFKQQIAQTFSVHYIKKDMLARTNGPTMRVNVMHISCKQEVVDDATLSVGNAPAR